MILAAIGSAHSTTHQATHLTSVSHLVDRTSANGVRGRTPSTATSLPRSLPVHPAEPSTENPSLAERMSPSPFARRASPLRCFGEALAHVMARASTCWWQWQQVDEQRPKPLPQRQFHRPSSHARLRTQPTFPREAHPLRAQAAAMPCEGKASQRLRCTAHVAGASIDRQLHRPT